MYMSRFRRRHLGMMVTKVTIISLTPVLKETNIYVIDIYFKIRHLTFKKVSKILQVV